MLNRSTAPTSPWFHSTRPHTYAVPDTSRLHTFADLQFLHWPFQPVLTVWHSPWKELELQKQGLEVQLSQAKLAFTQFSFETSVSQFLDHGSS